MIFMRIVQICCLLFLCVGCGGKKADSSSRELRLAVREAARDGEISAAECKALRAQSTEEGSIEQLDLYGWAEFLQDNKPRGLDDLTIACASTNSGAGAEEAGRSNCPATPDTVNFLIENSYSMYGYLVNGSDFLKVMSDYVLQFDQQKQPFELFFINDGLHPIDELPGEYTNAQDIFERKRHFESYLSLKKMAPVGDTRSSKLMKVLNVVTDKAVADCEPQFLVSDYVYSLAGVRNMQEEMTGIQSDVSLLIGKVAEAGLATMIIKYNSSFKGSFYAFDAPRGFDYEGRRPYYIWAFGTQEYLTSFVEKYTISKQPGYQHHVIYTPANKKEVAFGIFPNSADPYGEFRKSPKTANPVHALSDVAASKRQGGIRFAVGVNLNAYPVNDGYRTNPRNFEIRGPEEEKWQVAEILPLNGSLSDRDAKLVTPVEPTHFLVIEGEDVKSKSSSLTIRFLDQKPDWLLRSHTDDDSKARIDEVKDQTFGFAYLSDGVWDAYHDRMDQHLFFELPITLNR